MQKPNIDMKNIFELNLLYSLINKNILIIKRFIW